MCLGAKKQHVFEEVRQPLLVVILVNRTCPYNQNQLCPVFRVTVGTHVIGHAVFENAFTDFWVFGDRGIKIDTVLSVHKKYAQ